MFWTGFGTDFEIGSGGLGALLGAFGALIFTIHEVVSEARNKTNNNMRKVMKYCIRKQCQKLRVLPLESCGTLDENEPT